MVCHNTNPYIICIMPQVESACVKWIINVFVAKSDWLTVTATLNALFLLLRAPSTPPPFLTSTHKSNTITYTTCVIKCPLAPV